MYPNTVEVEGVQVEAHVASALQMLVEAAAEDGLALTFSEGYVSYEGTAGPFRDPCGAAAGGRPDTVMARTQARLTVPMAGECDQQTGPVPAGGRQPRDLWGFPHLLLAAEQYGKIWIYLPLSVGQGRSTPAAPRI